MANNLTRTLNIGGQNFDLGTVTDVIASKTYTAASNAYFTFLRQIDYSKPFFARLRITTKGASGVAISQTISVEISSRNNLVQVVGYDNTRTTWSADSGIYTIRGFVPKEAINEAYKDHPGGAELYTNGTNSRTIEIDAYELVNCNLLDSLAAASYNSSYHNNSAPVTCSNRIFGTNLQGSADFASISQQLREGNIQTATSQTVGVGRKTICCLDVQRSDAASITTKFNSVGTDHTVNTATDFHFGSQFCYCAENSDHPASTSTATMYVSTYNLYFSADVDLRYSCNCGTAGFTQRKSLYIRVYPDFTNGVFTIHPDGLTQSLSSGGYYIRLGRITNTNAYTLHLDYNQPLFYYNGTELLYISGVNSNITLKNSGANVGSYGDSSAQTPGYGDTFKVPFITVDEKGIVTNISEHTVKIPTTPVNAQHPGLMLPKQAELLENINSSYATKDQLQSDLSEIESRFDAYVPKTFSTTRTYKNGRNSVTLNSPTPTKTSLTAPSASGAYILTINASFYNTTSISSASGVHVGINYVSDGDSGEFGSLQGYNIYSPSVRLNHFSTTLIVQASTVTQLWGRIQPYYGGNVYLDYSYNYVKINL